MRLALHLNLTFKQDLTIEDAARISTTPSKTEIAEKAQERMDEEVETVQAVLEAHTAGTTYFALSGKSFRAASKA